MTRLAYSSNAVLSFVVLAAALLTSAPALAQRVFFVDFDSGNDAANGLTPATAWKRAPGDPLATSQPRNVRLAPGDTIRFRGGVRYRGVIHLRHGGTADRPITLDGSAWGPTRAVFDGSDPLPAATPCPSAQACLDAPNWRSLVQVRVASTARWSDWLFSADQPLSIAQFPTPSAPFAYDDIDEYRQIPLTGLNALRQGHIAAANLPASLATGDPGLILWSQPNKLHFVSSFQISPQGISFPTQGFTPYTDRANRYAIMNTASQITRPGQFAISPSRGIAVAWPQQAGSRFSIGARRNAILFTGADHVRVHGFVFANYAGNPNEVRTGVPLLTVSGSDGLRITENNFTSIALTNGAGVGNFNWVKNLSVTGNRIEQAPFSSGFRVGNSDGPVNLSCNVIRQVGRTAIYLQNVGRARIVGNHISQVNGIHGNGISLYLDNRDVEVTGNVVVDSARPLTMTGDRDANLAQGPARAVRITGNTLIGNDPSSAALISWGSSTNVTIASNKIGGPGHSLRLAANDSGFALNNNQLIGRLTIPATARALQTGNQLFAPTGNGAAMLTSGAQQTVSRNHCS